MVFPGLCPIFQEEEEILTKRKYKDCWKVVFFFHTLRRMSKRICLFLPHIIKAVVIHLFKIKQVIFKLHYL